MAQSANHVKLSENPENLGWELFEVGSHDEVIRLSNNHPNSPFLNQLALLARLEEKSKISESTPMGITILSPIVEAYLYYQKKNTKKQPIIWIFIIKIQILLFATSLQN